MWAGGSFKFSSDPGATLRAGSPATAHFSVSRVEKKGMSSRDGDRDNNETPMVFVHQKIEYEQDNRVAVEEERIHVYLPQEARANIRSVREGNLSNQTHLLFVVNLN